MPAAQRASTMELLGKVLLSAALLTFCSVGGEEDINATTIKPQTSPGSITTISITKANHETSPMSTRKPPTAGNTATTANFSAAAHPTQANGLLSTSNDTASTGTAESPAQSSVTSSDLALTAPGQHNMTTATPRAPLNKNATQRHIQDTLGKVTELPAERNTVNAHSEKQDHPSYTTIILPVIIALIVISLSVFLLVTLYRMCLKTTPERQENGTEQAPLDKENVKLISVKTTSPESGDQASQGKNRTRQQNDSSSSHLGNKRV